MQVPKFPLEKLDDLLLSYCSEYCTHYPADKHQDACKDCKFFEIIDILQYARECHEQGHGLIHFVLRERD